MAEPIVLDVRHLAPPEPMERILLGLRLLEGDRELRVLIHREPFPLYEILAKRGFAWRTSHLPEVGYELVIARDPGAAPG